MSKTILKKSDLYTLNFEYRQDYLYAFVGEGKDSLAVSKEFWLRVLTESKKQQYYKVLVEEDLDGKISLPELYDLAVWLTKLQFENVLIAFFDRRTDHWELNKFGELIATNRGFRITVFENINMAEKWLLSQ
jgi:hypothetical protein